MDNAEKLFYGAIIVLVGTIFSVFAAFANSTDSLIMSIIAVIFGGLGIVSTLIGAAIIGLTAIGTLKDIMKG